LFILGAVYIITILAAPQGLWNLGKRRSAGDEGSALPTPDEVRA
jgi:hypothetical protein